MTLVEARIAAWVARLPPALGQAQFVDEVRALATDLGIEIADVRFTWGTQRVLVQLPPRIQVLPFMPTVLNALEDAARRIAWPDPSTLSDDAFAQQMRLARHG